MPPQRRGYTLRGSRVSGKSRAARGGFPRPSLALSGPQRPAGLAARGVPGAVRPAFAARSKQAPAAARAPRAGALAAGRRLWAGRWCPLSSAPLHRKEKNRSPRAHPLSHTAGSGIFSPSLISSAIVLEANEEASPGARSRRGEVLVSPPAALYSLSSRQIRETQSKGLALGKDSDHAGRLNSQAVTMKINIYILLYYIKYIL